MSEIKKVFTPVKTALEFYRNPGYINIIRGVRGSGKTISCLMWLFIVANRQAPASDNTRYTRFAIIRDTYPNLDSSVIKSFESWFTQNVKKKVRVSKSYPRECKIEYKLDDGTRVNTEFYFFGIQNEDAAENLKSREYTWIYCNELSTLNKSILDLAEACIGRYPDASYGGITSTGIVCDTNTPNKDNWLYDYEKNCPPQTKFFVQPPVKFQVIDKITREVSYISNYDADNLINLEQPPPLADREYTYEEKCKFGMNYYDRRMGGKSLDWIKRDILNEYGDGFSGLGFYSDLFKKNKDDILIDDIVKSDKDEVIVGFDTSGFNPACVFVQYIKNIAYVQHTLVANNCPLFNFVYDILLPFIEKNYKNYVLNFNLDPSNARDSLTGEAPLITLQKANLRADVAITNIFKRREDTVNYFLNSKKYKICKDNDFLVKALEGGYCRPTVKINNVLTNIYNKPNKNSEYSHLMDAHEYALLYIHNYYINVDDNYNNYSINLNLL